MDFKALGDWLSGEIDVMSHVSFWVVVGVFAFVIWKAVQREYATRLANADSTISMLRERLRHAETNETMAIAATEQVIEAREDVAPAPVVVAERPEPAAPQMAPPAPKAKEWVANDFNPAAILEVLRNKTGLQAQAELNPYKGKWMRVRGAVRAANALPPNGGLLGLTVEDDRHLTFCVFRPVPDEVTELEIGQVVEVEGKIGMINGNSLTLDECALLSVGSGAQPS